MQPKSMNALIRHIMLCAAATMFVAGSATAQGEGASDNLKGLMLIFLVPLGVLAKSALQAVIAALFPHFTAKANAAISDRRALCILWGLLTAVLAFVVLLITGALTDAGGVFGLLAIPGLVLCLAIALLANLGFVGPSSWMGERMLPSDPSGPDRTPMQAFVGALALSFASLIPIIGWTLMLLLVFGCLGAGLVALFGRAKPPARGAATPTSES